MEVWTKDHQFPIDIDYMISDMLDLLRPKMLLCCSLEEACHQVSELEREVLVKLGLFLFPFLPTSDIRIGFIYYNACI